MAGRPAEGLGVGWVTLFQPADLAALLRLPEGVVTLGWLCVGWPDERPPAPGLERAGWSRRLPLSAVVVSEVWPGEDSAPPAPPSALRAPAPTAVVAARDEADRLLTTPGSLGVLDRAVDRVAALGCRDLSGGTLIIAAADHAVAARGVSTTYSSATTRDVVAAAVVGSSLGATAARAAGLSLRVVDVGVAGGPVPGAEHLRVDGPRGDLVDRAAMNRQDTDTLLATGERLGRELAGDGLVVLGEVGIANTTVAAALTCGLLDADPALVTGQGAGADADMLARKRDVVAAALRRARSHEGLSGDPVLALAELGGPELALLTGVTLGAARAGAPVLLDGFATSVAALVAVLLEPAAHAALLAGQRTRERGHGLVLEHLGLEPLLDLRLRAGEGVGGVLAAGLLLHALTLRRETGGSATDHLSGRGGTALPTRGVIRAR